MDLGGGWVASPVLAGLLAAPPKAPAWHLEPEAWPDAWLQLLVARRAVAASRRAVLSHRCAALSHGWAVLEDPATTELAIPQGRKMRDSVRTLGAVTIVRRTLTPDELTDGVTSPLRTVLDCAAALPFRDALAIADSALRSGDVGQSELIEGADRLSRRGAAVRVARSASALAANPFESALRALVLDVQGAVFLPQVEIRTAEGTARVDLGDPDLRIAVEADSYLFHGSRDGFTRDLRRYNALAALDWAVVRVGFEDLMMRPDAIRRQVQEVVWARTRFR